MLLNEESVGVGWYAWNVLYKTPDSPVIEVIVVKNVEFCKFAALE